jgi:hypothetical protein
MKHIKIFEEYKPKPLFKDDDYVRFLESGFKDEVFQIKSVTYFKNVGYKYYIVDINHPENKGSIKEYQLRLIPDYEIDANKYNL